MLADGALVLRKACLVPALALAATSCFGSNPNVTASGAGIPEVEVEFAGRVEAGSVQQARVTVTNPGPEDMTSVVITFTRVGNDYPLIDAGAPGAGRAVASVDPKPVAANAAELVYTFGPLGEGEARTYTFDIRVPDRRGMAANAVTASDGSEAARIKGARLATTVE